MKKHSGIFAACAAVVLLAGTACYFSGVPYYIKTKKEYAEVLSRHPADWKYADKGILADGMELTVNGVRLTVPKGMKQSVRSDGTTSENIYEIREDGRRVVLAMVAKPDDMGKMPLSQMDPRSEKELKSFLDTQGKEAPADWASLQKLVFDLDLSDSVIHSYTKAGVQYYLAQLKEALLPDPAEEAYYCDNEQGRGLILIHAPHDEIERYSITLDLFSPDTPNQSPSAIVSAKDLDTAIKMANSFTFVGTEPK